MREAAANLEFEEAGRIRDEIRRLESRELLLAEDVLGKTTGMNAMTEERVTAAAGQAPPGRSKGGVAGSIPKGRARGRKG